ncbi:MAG: hypothetical protein ACO1PI_10805 [Bacteroidota bacterium]
MKATLLIVSVLVKSMITGQTIPGELLNRNGIDSTANTLLVNIHAANCKNCIYLNQKLFTDAKQAGYKTYFNVRGLAKEDLQDFRDENGFAKDYPVVLDKQLSQQMEEGHFYVLQGTTVVSKTDCEYTEPLHEFFEKKNAKKIAKKAVDSIAVDTSYKFYSGSAAYLNREYCLVLDFRHSRKLHKINIQTGKIAQQFTLDEKLWAEKIYTALYNGDAKKVSKSLKARQLYLKKDRIFNEQEFEPENITVKNNRTILSIRFYLPFISAEGDTLRKNTKVLFQLNDSLQIIDYWVIPIQFLPGDFYVPRNSNMTPLLLLGDTVCLSVSYIHYAETPLTKYNYAKFILDKNHTVKFHSYLPFTVPEDKGGITGDYNVPHMYLLKYGEQIAGSYITFPAIYNLTANTKIDDLELIGKPKQLKNKMDSVLFANDINNLKFMISYFNRYNDKYYVMQCKNASWNTYILFDNNFQRVQSIYIPQTSKDEGVIFHAENGTAYIIKFGVKEDSDMYILKQSMTNLFDMEVD